MDSSTTLPSLQIFGSPLYSSSGAAISSALPEEIELCLAVSQLSSSIWTISVSSSISCRSSGMSRCDIWVSCWSFSIDVLCGLFCQLVVACCVIWVDVDWWFVNYQLVVIVNVVFWVLLGSECCYVILWFYWERLVCWYYGYEFSVWTCVIGWGGWDELLCVFLMVFSWQMDYAVSGFVSLPVHVLLILGVFLCGCRHKGGRVIRCINCHWATLRGVGDQIDDLDWFICSKFGCVYLDPWGMW